MNNERRLQIYTRGVTYPLDSEGYYRLTPKQRKRAQKKLNADVKRRATAEFISIYDEVAEIPDVS
jgi:hypothetical protein